MIINIIGAGRLGKTLAKLWSDQKVFEIGDVYCRTSVAAEGAASFIRAGRPVISLRSLNPADVYLISTPDSLIQSVAEKLTLTSNLQDTVITHCSGSLTSAVFSCVNPFGGKICSVHPVHSFSAPELSIKSFKGTLCGVEGDQTALKTMIPAFEKIGGEIFHINADAKIIYHAAAAIACPYTIVLQNIAIQMLLSAGIDEKKSMKILEPIMRGTIESIFQKGPVEALTGPISRGDVDTVRTHLKEITKYDDSVAEIYKLLGKKAADISKSKSKVSIRKLKEIINILESK